MHLIGCLSVCQSATYVLLLSIGYKWDAGAPIFYDHPPGTPAVDPVVQALVLTDIVVGATISALLLALTLQMHKRKGTVDPLRAEAVAQMRGGKRSPNRGMQRSERDCEGGPDAVMVRMGASEKTSSPAGLSDAP